MTDERLIELALGSEAATAEESVAMAMRLLNWHQTEKGGPMLEDFNIFSAKSMKEFHESKTMNHASTENRCHNYRSYRVPQHRSNAHSRGSGCDQGIRSNTIL